VAATDSHTTVLVLAKNDRQQTTVSHQLLKYEVSRCKGTNLKEWPVFIQDDVPNAVFLCGPCM
jgi:hypothetical protein